MSYDLANNLLAAPTPILYQSGHRIDLREVPLHLLAHILSYIDDVSDLARLCRTSRLLHYMSVRQLYRRITLTSYDKTQQHRDDSDDGLWHANPLVMGLTALATRKTAALVEELAIEGIFHDNDLDLYRKRRLPDSTVLLNISIRAVIDRCSNLRSFRYFLNVRPSLTLYTGLADLSSLQSFYLQMSATKTEQPHFVVPPMPNLRQFAFTEYDPLCYPDDLSAFFLHAVNLESLTMHFSLRLRNANEPAPFFEIFHRNLVAKKGFNLQSIGMYNVPTNTDTDVHQLFLPDRLEEIALVNSYGPNCTDVKSQATQFINFPWLASCDEKQSDFKTVTVMRTDKINALVVKDLANMPSLEKIYFINGSPSDITAKSGLLSPSPIRTTSSEGLTPIGPPIEARPVVRRQSTLPRDILRDSLISTVGRIQGKQLKHLILPAKLPCNIYSMSRLCAACPNITQLSFAMEEVDAHALRTLAPLASNLRCCRILGPNVSGPDGDEQRRMWAEFEAREDHGFYLNLELSGEWGNDPEDMANLKYVGFGQKVWETSMLHREVKTIVDEYGIEMEQKVFTRTVKRLSLRDVADVAIWKMDSFDPI